MIGTSARARAGELEERGETGDQFSLGGGMRGCTHHRWHRSMPIIRAEELEYISGEVHLVVFGVLFKRELDRGHLNDEVCAD